MQHEERVLGLGGEAWRQDKEQNAQKEHNAQMEQQALEEVMTRHSLQMADANAAHMAAMEVKAKDSPKRLRGWSGEPAAMATVSGGTVEVSSVGRAVMEGEEVIEGATDEHERDDMEMWAEAEDWLSNVDRLAARVHDTMVESSDDVDNGVDASGSSPLTRGH